MYCGRLQVQGQGRLHEPKRAQGLRVAVRGARWPAAGLPVPAVLLPIKSKPGRPVWAPRGRVRLPPPPPLGEWAGRRNAAMWGCKVRGLRAKLVEYGGDPLLVGPRAAGLRRAAGPELGSARAGWRGVYKRPARLAREVDGKDCQQLCASKVRWALDVGRRRGNDDAVVLSLSHPPMHVTGAAVDQRVGHAGQPIGGRGDNGPLRGPAPAKPAPPAAAGQVGSRPANRSDRASREAAEMATSALATAGGLPAGCAHGGAAAGARRRTRPTGRGGTRPV